MKKKRWLILGLQTAIVVGFSMVFVNYVQNEVKPVSVYEFNQDLSVNSKVTASDLTRITVPAKAVNTSFVLNPKNLIGKYVNTKVYKGDYVYASELTTQGNLDPFANMDMSKMRKISVPLTYVTGFAGNLKRGDKVDLIYTGSGAKTVNGQQQTFDYSKTFMQGVWVWNLNTADGYQFVDHSTVNPNAPTSSSSSSGSGQKISTSSTNTALGSVTLLVSLDQAEELETRLKAGTVEVVGDLPGSQPYQTLGYTLGNASPTSVTQNSPETGSGTIPDNNPTPSN